MPKREPITVHVECETARDYRALRHVVAGNPSRARFAGDGRIEVLDDRWFARLLASVDGRVVSEHVS